MKYTFVVITALPDGSTNQILTRTAEYKSFRRAKRYMPMHVDFNLLPIAEGEWIKDAFLVGEQGGMSNYYPSLDEWESTPRQNRSEIKEIINALHIGYNPKGIE